MSGFREGFYAFYYNGAAGKGVMLLCLKQGRMLGVDMGGGVLKGAYEQQGDTIVADCTFQFSAGQTLITGQKLSDAVEQSTRVRIPLSALEGEAAEMDIGFGPLSARGKFVAETI